MNLGTLGLIGACLLVVGRVYVPWARPIEGQVRVRLPVPLRAKVHRLALPLGLQLTLLLADAVFGWIPLWATVPALALSVVVFVAPARYTITDQGVAVGLTPFRRWTEFSGLSVRRGRIRLKAIRGLPGLEIWLPGRFQDAEVVTELRALVRDAYKGELARPATASPAPPPDEPRDESAPIPLVTV